MEIHVKKGQLRVDPRDPKTHPDYQRALEVGQKNFRKMKFENEAQKSDYLKRVAKNPNNVPGLPEFFPPLEMKEFVTMTRSLSEEEERKLEHWRLRDFQIREMELYCEHCNSVEPHSVSPEESFCKSCGNQKSWRTKPIGGMYASAGH